MRRRLQFIVLIREDLKVKPFSDEITRQHFLLSYFKTLSVVLQFSKFCGTIRTVTNNHCHGVIGGDGMWLSCFLRKTLDSDSNDQSQVADHRFSLKQWFAGGAQSRGLSKPGCSHCYLRFLIIMIIIIIIIIINLALI